ncbi:hypothetical protein D3C84_1117490 [compost metagenome]
MNVQKHLSLLGLRATDRVSGFSGVVTSIGFDLYGCIQAVLHPGANSDGKMGESLWFDVNRLEIVDQAPVMETPNFEFGPVAEGRHGPADKPAMGKA